MLLAVEELESQHRNRMEEDGSNRSRASACSQLTRSDTTSTEGDGEAQQGEKACAWAWIEQTFQGRRERISAGVVTQSVWGGGTDCLWRILERGQACREEAKEVPEKVGATVEETWQAGKLEHRLPPGDTGPQG